MFSYIFTLQNVLCFQKGKEMTLLMVDPDAPSRTSHRCRSWLHWMVVNIPVCNHHLSNISFSFCVRFCEESEKCLPVDKISASHFAPPLSCTVYCYQHFDCNLLADLNWAMFSCKPIRKSIYF